MSLVFLSYEKINEKIRDLGIFYIIAGAVSLVLLPFKFLTIPIILTKVNLLVSALIFLIDLTASALIIIAAIKTRVLIDVTDEELFNIGAILWIILIVFSTISDLIMMINTIRFLSTLTLTTYGVLETQFHTQQTMMNFSFLGIIIFGIIVGIFGFIVRLILAIAFWRFGENNKSDFIQVSALIFIFIESIGLILLGFAFYFLASKTERTLRNQSLLNAIKDHLSRNVPEGETVDIRDLAKKYDIAPYALSYLIREWIAADELKGFLSGNIYIQHKKERE